MANIVILGAGTAGTIMANRMRRLYARDVSAGRTTITVVDQETQHVYQPGLLFLPFGHYAPDQLVRPQRKQLHRHVKIVNATVDRVDASANTVRLANGSELPYDVLIVARYRFMRLDAAINLSTIDGSPPTCT